MKIYYQSWVPEKPKAAIQFLHGVTEHSGRFPFLMEALSNSGFAVYAGDHRGHGKSGGERLQVDSIDDLVADQKQLNDIIRDDLPDVPVFMIGYSLGGAIASTFMQKHEQLLRGAVLAGIASSVNIGRVKMLMLKIFSGIAPRKRFGPVLDGNLLTRNADIVASYMDDPLVAHTNFTIRSAHQLVDAYASSVKLSTTLRLPLLVQCGSEDKILKQFGGVVDEKALSNMFSMADKTIRVYEGLYHEVYNEPKEHRDIVLQDLVNWLNAHV